ELVAARCENELLDQRRALPRLLTERVEVDGDCPPAGRLESLGATGFLDRLARRLVPQEDHREPAALRRNERPRNRDQEAGAVSRLAVGRDRAPVPHADEPLEERVENLTRGPAARLGDEADAASIAFAG